MEHLSELTASMMHNWPVWLVTVALVVAAYIDGTKLKVPNWLTLPLIVSGWIYSVLFAGGMDMAWYEGLAWSLFGTAVGLGLLLPAYAIGGMGAGDVKLLMGVGAWMHGRHTFYAFCISAVVGAVLAVGMVVVRRGLKKHAQQFWMIASEILTIRDPDTLAGIAADRKGAMLLLPYGIPIAIGTVTYFIWMGMLL